MAARAFGPATLGVLILLWVMIIATIVKFGFQLPNFDLRAFSPQFLGFTFAGYARILAVMTGIEIFANLVAAYGGTPAEKSKKAFGSLIIIMGTTGITMLVVGPAILKLADPTNEHVSVFTQTMDQILPAPLAILGTLVGIAVLLSAAAASAQGLQFLFLGLKYRHYLPSVFGQRNKFEVADKPVWLEVGLVSITFLAFGTNEETYLAIYAAGVFILLSMTGWAAAKRLLRELRTEFVASRLAALVGTILAAMLTSGATVLIFTERFFDGAWTYLIFLPILYLLFSFFRQRLGDPPQIEERLGREMFGRYFSPTQTKAIEPTKEVAIKKVLVPLDGSPFSEQALQVAQALVHAYGAHLTLMSVHQDGRQFLGAVRGQAGQLKGELSERTEYLSQTTWQLKNSGIQADFSIHSGSIAEEISSLCIDADMDLVVMSTSGRTGIERLVLGSVANKVVQLTNTPVLLIRPGAQWRSRSSQFKRLLATLDGSATSEQILPYVRALGKQFESEVLLLSSPDAPGAEEYKGNIEDYLENVVANLKQAGLAARSIVTGAEPAETILAVSESEAVDLIMIATHGRGGLDRFMMGSVADRVVQQTKVPVFLVPIVAH